MKFKNAVLHRAIFPQWETVADFCKAVGLDDCRVGALLSFKVSPYHKRTGEPTGLAVKLASIFGYSVSELFPPELYSGLIPKDVLAFEIGSDRLLSLSAPETRPLLPSSNLEDVEAGIDRSFLEVAVEDALDDLDERQRAVLRRRFFDNQTLEEIGNDMGISKERIRQIEIGALRRLRQPARSGPLRGFLKALA